ncbi:MAG: hypothetical protein HWE13_02000 [Gammaproteobacteria bacterium]|nr:hypothetical protein [Gammaproteobacteria bacterium]NVK86865.1 hypothetical protein [Gammaproteobacteria bacterium]
MKRLLLLTLPLLLLSGCYVITHQEALVPRALEENAKKISIKLPSQSFFGESKPRVIGPYRLFDFKTRTAKSDHDRFDLGNLYGYEKDEFEQAFRFQFETSDREQPLDWTVYCKIYHYEKVAGVLIFQTDAYFRQGMRCDLKSPQLGLYQLTTEPQVIKVSNHPENLDGRPIRLEITPSYAVKRYGKKDGVETIEVRHNEEFSGYYFTSNQDYDVGLFSLLGPPTLWLRSGPVSPEQSLTLALSHSLLYYHQRLEAGI